MAKRIAWSEEKSRQLKADLERCISFDGVLIAFEDGRLLDDVQNPRGRFAHQRMFVIEKEGYVYAVPYVESEDEVFLKTAFPSRVFTRKYLKAKP